MMLREALHSVLAGDTLSRDQARSVFADAVSSEAEPVLLGGLLSALACRGEATSEIAGAVDALRDAMVPFEHDHAEAIDTAGTGGDGLGTFNLSTAAAIVAAAAGALVIKHGNRRVSSRCGSADLLAAVGIPLDLSPAAARVVLDDVGMTFLLATRYHPVLAAAAPVRASLGVRTMFNLLGPLLNPGRVRRQVLGVADPRRLAALATVLVEIGHEHAYVVHGHGGADELTLSGPNQVQAVGRASAQTFAASELGLAPAGIDALAGGDAAQNLRLLKQVLDGESSPLADAVALNAAAALMVAGVAEHPDEGLARAQEALASGRAANLLAHWRKTARQVADQDSPAQTAGEGHR